MHGDFSRWTFERAAGYRAVLLQQGRVLLDADLNEQTAITAHHDEVRTRDAVGRTGAPAAGAGFAIVDAAGAAPALTAWEDLRIAPGRFYVDGVLAEAEPVEGGGHALADQPHLRVTPDLPGLARAGGGRALRRRARRVDPPRHGRRGAAAARVGARRPRHGDARPDRLAAAAAPRRRRGHVRGGPRRGVPDTRAADDDRVARRRRRRGPTRAEITTADGYRRLENQLYRVEIHEVDPGTGAARYKWSRENGSVVAGLTAIGPTAVTGMDAELTLDREGRDEELAIGEGDLVEVTSTDRDLHGLPGHLATAGAPVGLLLPVAWSGTAPGGLDALGRAPIVRRWEGGPTPADATARPARGRHPGRASARRAADRRPLADPGADRAARLRARRRWRARSSGPSTTPARRSPQPPLGPRRTATIARSSHERRRARRRWTLRADCRRVFPPLTELVTIDLLGGDGQEATPATPLPEPVRVAVRNGGAARRRRAGALLGSAAGTSTRRRRRPAIPPRLTVLTDARGHAEVRWLLDASGPRDAGAHRARCSTTGRRPSAPRCG